MTLQTLGAIADVFAPSSWAAKRGGFLTRVFPSRQYMAHHMANQYSLPLTPMRRWTCYVTRVAHWLGKSVHLVRYALAHAQEAVRYIRDHFRDQHNRILLREWLHHD